MTISKTAGRATGPMRAAKPFVLTGSSARQLMEKIQAMQAQGREVSLDLTKTPMDVAGARVLLESIEFFAKAKGLQVDRRKLEDDQRFGERNIQFLTRLHNLAIGTDADAPSGLAARVACAKHLFSAESQGSVVMLRDIHAYRAHAVFDFGSREFDTLFEMNDGSFVRAALIQLACTDVGVARVCAEMGWSEATQFLPTERVPEAVSESFDRHER